VVTAWSHVPSGLRAILGAALEGERARSEALEEVSKLVAEMDDDDDRYPDITSTAYLLGRRLENLVGAAD
jgi:hypothetical protein